MNQKILVATGNSGKLIEIKNQLKSCNFKIFSLAEVFGKNLPSEPDENAPSFQGNALIKAIYYAKLSKMTAIADDSGLCVDALNGRPGIHSARYAIDNTGRVNFEFAAKKIFEELFENGVSINSKPKAQFVCNLTIFNPNLEKSFSFEGRVDGYLAYPARGDFGFGYDPIFIKNGADKTFGELHYQEKDKISHRAVAFKKLKEWLINGENQLF